MYPVKAVDFAGAGFFFKGYADNVECFRCTGGFFNFLKGEDPYLEHAK